MTKLNLPEAIESCFFLLTTSPNEASGLDSFTAVRFACEYKKKADMARLGLLGSFAEIKDRTRNRRSVSNENPFHCYFKESRRSYLPFLGLSLRFHGYLVIDLDVVIIVSHGVFEPLSVL